MTKVIYFSEQLSGTESKLTSGSMLRNVEYTSIPGIERISSICKFIHLFSSCVDCQLTWTRSSANVEIFVRSFVVKRDEK